MELIELRKTDQGLAEIKIKFAEKEKSYEFAYSDGEIFSADFPEELRKILRLLPSAISQSLLKRIEESLMSNVAKFPYKVEIETEILQLV